MLPAIKDGKLLDDQKSYRKLKKDAETALERCMNSRLLALWRQNILPKELYERLQSSGSSLQWYMAFQSA